MKRLVVLGLVVAVFVPLGISALLLPPFGEPSAPVHSSLRYLGSGQLEVAGSNVVSDIMLTYRGLDTAAAAAAVFAALEATLAVLLVGVRDEEPECTEPARVSRVVGYVVKMLAPFVTLFGVYLLVHAHMTGGGGFQSGTVLGALAILASLTLGRRRGLAVIPEKARALLHPVALLSLLVSGIAGLAFFGTYLAFPGGPNLAWLREVWVLVIGAGIGVGMVSTIATIFAAIEEQP